MKEKEDVKVGEKRSIKKELKCISKSIKQLMEAQEKDLENFDLRKLIAANIETKKGPSKKQIDLLFKYYNLPREPPNLSSLMYFYHEKSEEEIKNPKVLTIATSSFKKLPLKEQTKWNKKFNKVWIEYAEEIERWKEQQKETTVFMFNELYEEKLNKKLSTMVKNGCTSRGYSQKLNKNLKRITQRLPNIIFTDEPKVPPLTPFQFLAAGSKVSCSQVSLQDQLKNLRPIELKIIRRRCWTLKQRFKLKVLAYVSGLDEDKRRLFIGTRRHFYITLLHDDILESKWPNDIFPVIESDKKIPGLSKVLQIQPEDCVRIASDGVIFVNDVDILSIPTTSMIKRNSSRRSNILEGDSELNNSTGIENSEKMSIDSTSTTWTSKLPNSSDSFEEMDARKIVEGESGECGKLSEMNITYGRQGAPLSFYEQVKLFNWDRPEEHNGLLNCLKRKRMREKSPTQTLGDDLYSSDSSCSEEDAEDLLQFFKTAGLLVENCTSQFEEDEDEMS